MVIAWLAALFLAFGALGATAEEAGWSVWTAEPSASTVLAPYGEERQSFTRHYVTDDLPPDQRRDAELLGYAGSMRAKASECIEQQDASFTRADLDELYQLMAVSWEGLPADGIIMHWQAGGLGEARCLDARKWLSEDIPTFGAGRPGVLATPPKP